MNEPSTGSTVTHGPARTDQKATDSQRRQAGRVAETFGLKHTAALRVVQRLDAGEVVPLAERAVQVYLDHSWGGRRLVHGGPQVLLNARHRRLLEVAGELYNHRRIPHDALPLLISYTHPVRGVTLTARSCVEQVLDVALVSVGRDRMVKKPRPLPSDEVDVAELQPIVWELGVALLGSEEGVLRRLDELRALLAQRRRRGGSRRPPGGTDGSPALEEEGRADARVEHAIRHVWLQAIMIRGGGTYGSSTLLVGAPDRARLVLEALDEQTHWPRVSVTCEAGEDWARLCGHLIAGHEEVFGPWERAGGTGRVAHAEMLLRRTAARSSMPAFNLVIWEPQLLTPRTAWRLSSWVKQPAHGLVVLAGPDADGVLAKDAELLPNYLKLLRV